MKIFENLEESLDANHYVLRFGKYSCVYVVRSPTGNCQIFSIRDFKTLLNNDEINKIAQIKYISDKFSRPILLCDIQEKYLDLFNKTFCEESIIMKNKYISSNNSKMIMCMINTEKL